VLVQQREEGAMNELKYWQRLGERQLARRTLLRSGVLTGVGVAVLAGCGGRSSTTVGRAGTATASGGQPQRGGVFMLRNLADPDTLDIHQTSGSPSVWIEAPCYNQLLQFDPKNPDTKIIPDLADSYEVAGDGTSIVFKLHPGVTFHDGTGFDSEDVKANLDWIKNPPAKKVSPRQGTLDALDHVETPDSQTAKLVLKRPNPSLISSLASEYFAIGSKNDLAKGDLGTQLNGSGPFRLKNYAHGVSLELERNPNYWVRGRPYLDGAKLSFVADENTAFTDFLAGQFHRYYPVAAENVGRVAKATGGRAKSVVTASLGRNYVYFNGTRKPYNDIRVRQAISLVLDRQAAIKTVYGGYAVPGGYLLPGGQWAISSDQLKTVPGYDKPDITKAKQLLAAAGVTEPLTGSILSRVDANFQNFSTFVQGTLQQTLSWNFTIDTEDAAGNAAKAYAGQFDLCPFLAAVTTDDPDEAFSEFATQNAARNFSKIYDAEADALFEKQSQTLDAAQRKQMVQELELKYLNDFALIGVFFQQGLHGIWNTVQNYTIPISLYTNQRYEDVWLSKS
jgi:peptide/nickel transport system substrate-binding protein